MALFNGNGSYIEDPLNKGMLGYIRRKWDEVVSATGRTAAAIVSKASLTGIGKGLLLTFGGIVAAGIVTGAFAGQAQMLNPLFEGARYENGMVSGMFQGAYDAAAYALGKGGFWLAIGAAVGGVSDYRAYSFNRDAAAARVKVTQGRGPGGGGPEPMQDKGPDAPDKGPDAAAAKENVAPEKTSDWTFDDYSSPKTGWAERHPNDNRSRGNSR